MKKYFYIILLALVAIACSREELPVPDHNANPAIGQNTMTIIACTEKPDISKTTLRGDDYAGYDVVWSSGDDFRLLYKYGRNYSYWGYLTYSICSAPGTTSASFSTTDTFKSEDFSNPVVSFYPASLVPDRIEGMTSTMTGPLVWPACQEYVTGTASRCPMVSLDTDMDGTVSFRNLGGILRMTVKGSGMITSIRIAADQKMSGSFHANTDVNPVKTVMDYAEGEDGSIVLDCGEGVQLSESGVNFNFNVPAGTYTNFSVEFYNGDLLIGTRKAKKDIVIERSMITQATMTAPVLNPGKLLGVEGTKVVTKEALAELAGELAGEKLGPNASLIKYLFPLDLLVVPVRYATTDVDGNLVEASGLIAYPEIPENDYNMYSLNSIVSIQHGTCDIADAPSKQNLPMELLPAAVGFREGSSTIDLLFGRYFVACMADYLGYGATENSDLLHPYLHNKLTGSTCADLIAATEEYIEEYGLELTSSTVNLVGYSQGGSATISTMLELLGRDEQTWSTRIGSVWAGAGPYDILAFMDSFAQSKSYSRSCYIPYAMRGLAYGERLSIDWDNVYCSEVGNTGMGGNQLEAELFSKTQVSTWTEEIGTDVTKILSPDFYGDGNADIQKIKDAAWANSLTNCTAPGSTMKKKIKLYHSPDDNTVPFVCSENLQKAWEIESISKLTPEDHVEAGVEFLLKFCGVDKLMDASN